MIWALLLGACVGGADSERADSDADAGSDAPDSDADSDTPPVTGVCADRPRSDLGLMFCVEQDERGQPGQGDGAFTAWNEDGTGTFVDTSGASWEVRHSVGSALRPYWPDLVAAGEVTVVAEGALCVDTDGSSWTILVHRRGIPADVLVAWGTREATLGGWTVTMGPQEPPCPARPDEGCFDTVENQALTFSRGDVTAVVPQAAMAIAGGHALAAQWAVKGLGPTHCDDGPWPDQMSWWILPAP